jgi:guanine deaminase
MSSPPPVLDGWRGMVFTFLHSEASHSGAAPRNGFVGGSAAHGDAPYRRQHGRYVFLQDGIVSVDAATGLIHAVDDAAALLARCSFRAVTRRPDTLLLPGFIDCHVHYPQVEMVGSYGAKLLDWLENFTFPMERKFADAAHATRVSKFFLREMLSCGTTTALVFGTVAATSVECFFTECERLNLRMICGKVLMDKGPEGLRDDPESAYRDSLALIERWHGRGRLLYAVTPRFAVTSSDAQLAAAGRLLREHPTVYMHTHINECKFEMAAVEQLFPDDADYLSVYDRHGLVGPKSVFAHCIHCQPAEWRRLHEAACSIAFCPTSNNFMGSGLFPRKTAFEHGIPVGMATDVGGGTSMSMLRTLDEAYKAIQLTGDAAGAHPLNLMHDATLGGAAALGLAGKVGTLEAGNEADFCVVDLAASAMMRRRMATLFPGGAGVADEAQLAELLFVPVVLGDERTVASTVVMGKVLFDRDHPAGVAPEAAHL